MIKVLAFTSLLAANAGAAQFSRAPVPTSGMRVGALPRVGAVVGAPRAMALPTALPKAMPAPIPLKAPAALPAPVPTEAKSFLGQTETAFRKAAPNVDLAPVFFDRARAASMPDLPSGQSVSLPDQSSSWYDRHTGQYETEATKIKAALDYALSFPTAKAIKDKLPYNTLYRVDRRSGISYVARTEGDNPQKTWETEPVVVFTRRALTELSPEYLAAKLASMWVRHLYKAQMPESAEKTYVEGSIFVRAFMYLSGSTAQNWNGDVDYVNGGNFEAYKHFYHWIQGSNYQNVRQGPYFKDKIMRQEGDPAIFSDPAGRRTLFQRAQAGEISGPDAQKAQELFDRFVANEGR
jgi:hypothetical protein